MPLLPISLRFLLSTTGTVLFVLAIVTIVVAVKTADNDLEIRHKSYSEKHVTDCRFHFSRGGLWVMRLRETRPSGGGGGYLPMLSPNIWDFAWINPDWQERLTPEQTGPIHFGFSSKSSHFQGQFSEFGMIADAPSNETITANGSLTRVPLWPIIAVLLLIPGMQLVWSIRQRSAKLRIKRTRLLAVALDRLFNIATVSSIICFSIVLWLLARSYSGNFYATWTSSWDDVDSPFLPSEVLDRELVIDSNGWQFSRDVAGEPRVQTKASHQVEFGIPPRLTGQALPTVFGFAFLRQEITSAPAGFSGTRHVGWTARVPHWAMLMTFAILPAILLRRRNFRRQRAARIRLGRCLTCGYDLRASPERCPECGAESTRPQ